MKENRKTPMSARIATLTVAAMLALSMLAGCTAESEKEELNPPDTTAVVSEDVSVSGEITTVSEVESETEPEPETEITTETEVTSETEAVTTTVTTTAEAVTTETPAETEETTLEYTVEYAYIIMYAKSAVNVRTGPSVDYECKGHLNAGDEVLVTGIASTGWYEIYYKDSVGYVSNNYLVSEKPETTTVTTATSAATTVTTTAAAAATTVATTTATTTSGSDEALTTDGIWVAAWGAAMLTAGTDQTPSTSLNGATIRQQIRPSIDGDRLRLVISNEYGKTDLVIESATIATLNKPSSYNIDTASCVTLTYNGSSKITVPAGKKITLDVVDFSYGALDDLAITMYISSAPTALTSHTASRCSTWITSGNHISDNSFSGSEVMTAWYFIAEMDVIAPSDYGAIVCLGDSLTDGASVTDNAFARYTDKLAELLQADSSLSNYSVINMGIGATALYSWGLTGVSRVDRDIINVAGVKYCIVLMGVNDIGSATTDISSNIISSYEKIIEKCHKAGIHVIGCTITPFKGNSYYSDLHEQIRLTVNKYIVSSDSAFDGYVDLASAVASSTDSAKMDSQYVSKWGDYLHFNDTGYRYVGTTVYNYLKTFIK